MVVVGERDAPSVGKGYAANIEKGREMICATNGSKRVADEGADKKPRGARHDQPSWHAMRHKRTNS